MTQLWDIEYDEDVEPPGRKAYPCEQCGTVTDALGFCHHCGSPLFDPDEDMPEDFEYGNERN